MANDHWKEDLYHYAYDPSTYVYTGSVLVPQGDKVRSWYPVANSVALDPGLAAGESGKWNGSSWDKYKDYSNQYWNVTKFLTRDEVLDLYNAGRLTYIGGAGGSNTSTTAYAANGGWYDDAYADPCKLYLRNQTGAKRERTLIIECIAEGGFGASVRNSSGAEYGASYTGAWGGFGGFGCVATFELKIRRPMSTNDGADWDAVNYATSFFFVSMQSKYVANTNYLTPGGRGVKLFICVYKTASVSAQARSPVTGTQAGGYFGHSIGTTAYGILLANLGGGGAGGFGTGAVNTGGSIPNIQDVVFGGAGGLGQGTVYIDRAASIAANVPVATFLDGDSTSIATTWNSPATAGGSGAIVDPATAASAAGKPPGTPDTWEVFEAPLTEAYSGNRYWQAGYAGTSGGPSVSANGTYILGKAGGLGMFLIYELDR